MSSVSQLLSELTVLDQQRANKQDELSKALKGLPENSSLLYFYGGSCPFTKRVEPAVVCLESKLGSRIKRLEIYENSENREEYTKVGGATKCGGVPFFYNRATGASLCGAGSCEALQQWATNPTVQSDQH